MSRHSLRSSKNAWLGAAALALLGSSLGLSCSSNSPQVSPPLSACNSVLGCGGSGGSGGASTATCSSTADCPTGQYCNASGKCSADCTPGDSRCGPNATCDATGKCVDLMFSFDAGTTEGGAGGEGGAGPGCVKLTVTFTPQIPTVIMLVDQSGSMVERFDTGTRWNVLRTALVDPATGVISTLQSKVRFGLALYTSLNGIGNDPTMPKQCPIITEVPPALDNYTAIAAKYLPDDQKDDTPTGESVDAAVKILSAVTDSGPKVIVLATDGEPDTCASWDPTDPAGLEAARQVALAAVQNAYKANVTTFVISVGNEIGDAHLREVANAGQGLAIDVDTTNRFYRANSQADLSTAFNSIINGVRSCVMQLNGNVDLSQASEGSVELDGTALGYKDENGWRLNSTSELELLGSACTKIKDGDHQLAISFPCGVIKVIPR